MKNANRKFGLIVGGAFIAIFIYKLVFHHLHFIILGYVGGALLLTAIVAPAILNLLRIFWEKIGTVLGIINSHIILFIVYFLVITPIGLMMRLRNKNLLWLKKQYKSTYWQPVTKIENSSLKQQF